MTEVCDYCGEVYLSAFGITREHGSFCSEDCASVPQGRVPEGCADLLARRHERLYAGWERLARGDQ